MLNDLCLRVRELWQILPTVVKSKLLSELSTSKKPIDRVVMKPSSDRVRFRFEIIALKKKKKKIVGITGSSTYLCQYIIRKHSEGLF